jgi:hypothetical protein
MFKFKIHFNRINMQRGNPKVWTVHNSRGCFQGEKVVLEVPVETVFKPNGKQPRAYFIGRGIVSVDQGGTIYVRNRERI